MIYKVKADEIVNEKFTRIVAPRNFYTKDFNNSYKAWVKRRTYQYRITHRHDIQKILKTIFRIARDTLLEREGGVVLEGLGYLSVYMPMYRRFTPQYFANGAVAYPYYHTDYYSYYPYLFTDVFNRNKLDGWSIQEGFSKGITEKLEKKKYKNYYNEVKLIYTGE